MNVKDMLDKARKNSSGNLSSLANDKSRAVLASSTAGAVVGMIYGFRQKNDLLISIFLGALLGNIVGRVVFREKKEDKEKEKEDENE